jgi:hypothetical protein
LPQFKTCFRLGPIVDDGLTDGWGFGEHLPAANFGSKNGDGQTVGGEDGFGGPVSLSA